MLKLMYASLIRATAQGHGIKVTAFERKQGEHRRGTLFTADFVAQGAPPARLFENTAYADPPAKRFDPPLLVRVGDEVAYGCPHDNATDPRLGCEGVADMTPGITPVERIAQTRDAKQLVGSAGFCRVPAADLLVLTDARGLESPARIIRRRTKGVA